MPYRLGYDLREEMEHSCPASSTPPAEYPQPEWRYGVQDLLLRLASWWYATPKSFLCTYSDLALCTTTDKAKLLLAQLLKKLDFPAIAVLNKHYARAHIEQTKMNVSSFNVPPPCTAALGSAPSLSNRFFRRTSTKTSGEPCGRRVRM